MSSQGSRDDPRVQDLAAVDLGPGLSCLPSSAAITPEPHLGALDSNWEEHEHLMNPMFLQVISLLLSNNEL